MPFIITYAILAAISFVVFAIISEYEIRKLNSMLTWDIYQVSYFKITIMALFFPFAWSAIIIHTIFGGEWRS